MKQVTMESVKERIEALEGAENVVGIGLHAEFELACLRELVAATEQRNSVLAEGVEMFAESQKEYVRVNRSSLDAMTRAAYCGSAVDAEKFARQLRESKGAQS